MPDGRLLALLLVALSSLSGPVVAEPALKTASRYFDDAQRVGGGVLRHLFWEVYQVELIAPAANWRVDKPFVLSLRYLRSIDGVDIADRTISEIRDQGFSDERALVGWQMRLRDIFPDVSDGTRLTGVRDSEGRTVFYEDGRRIGEIRDAAFTRRFFDIWLSEKTSEPSLRRALLGGT